MTWNAFKDYLKLILIAIVAVLVVIMVVYNEMSMWDECRAEHSFWFCWRLFNR